MSRTALLVRRTRPALAAAALVCAGGLVSTTPADAAPSATVTTASLLTIEDVRAAGLDGDSATLSRTGDAQLDDGGHNDENCLSDKTIRAVTGAKSYPAAGTGRGYADGTWSSTQDKEVYVTESVAQGATAKDTDRYVATLTRLITRVRDCQEDPAQGIRHAPVRHVDAGGVATADYYATVYPDGHRDGGGVAVVRDGTRFGIVSLTSGRDTSAYTLKRLATTAAQRLR
ncbi:hypothetical protein [Microlunatus antarcticus]|uniref:PknH-like extracellular domain-containing protein n=1 Tax=Microlunatus antarcticus TaxID=53388 RepID=A0A7W5JSD7_9ACTN|nr:hypothetical protein [Microlunatus antarcticus]MBB3325452.1 hypothetical protein [Microlunatus antarcticus]